MSGTEEVRMIKGSTAGETNKEQGYDDIYSKRDDLITQLNLHYLKKYYCFWVQAYL
jgi:hypothetical protein